MRESIKLIVSRPYFPEKMHQVDNSDGGYCFLYLSQWNWCCVLFYTNEMIVVVCFLSALSRDRVYRFCWDGPRRQADDVDLSQRRLPKKDEEKKLIPV